MKNFYYTEKKVNGYAIGTHEQKQSLGNRSYLMSLIWENDNMWITKNEIFYTTANAAQIRKKYFLKNNKYMENYWSNDDDKKIAKFVSKFFIKTISFVDESQRLCYFMPR